MGNKTVFDGEARAELIGRIRRLGPDSTRRWGQMSCGQMVAHLADALRMTFGELEIMPRGGPLRFAPIRYLLIHKLPFPRGAPTAPELISRDGTDLSAEVEALITLLTRFGDANVKLGAEHPAFGPLTRNDWGVLVYRHTSHHLNQFGV